MYLFGTTLYLRDVYKVGDMGCCHPESILKCTEKTSVSWHFKGSKNPNVKNDNLSTYPYISRSSVKQKNTLSVWEGVRGGGYISFILCLNLRYFRDFYVHYGPPHPSKLCQEIKHHTMTLSVIELHKVGLQTKEISEQTPVKPKIIHWLVG